MELVTINSPEDINVGDVVVANWSDHAYTALINDIENNDVGQEGAIVWTFKCQPVTEIRTDENGVRRMIHTDSMTYYFNPDVDEVPNSVYSVR